MLGTARIHPKLAFEHCGMFSDAETAFEMSEEYYNKQLEQWEVKADVTADNANGNDHPEQNQPNEADQEGGDENGGENE